MALTLRSWCPAAPATAPTAKGQPYQYPLAAQDSPPRGLAAAWRQPAIGARPRYLDVDLVAAEDNRDVLADADQVLVPGRHVLVGDARGHIEHDDGALAIDIVAIAQTAEALLAGGVPGVEADSATVGVEGQWVHLHTEGGCNRSTAVNCVPASSAQACPPRWSQRGRGRRTDRRISSRTRRSCGASQRWSCPCHRRQPAPAAHRRQATFAATHQPRAHRISTHTRRATSCERHGRPNAP